MLITFYMELLVLTSHMAFTCLAPVCQMCTMPIFDLSDGLLARLRRMKVDNQCKTGTGRFAEFLAGKRGMALLFLAAFVFRIAALGRASLWQDEILFVQTSSPALHPFDVIKSYWDIVVSMAWMPLPAVLQNIYFHVAGSVIPDIAQKPFWIRLPGTLWGSFAVLGVFALARRLLDRNAAPAAGIMTAVFFFPVFYAREAHAYPMLWFFAAFSLNQYFKLLGAQRSSLKDLIVFGVCLAGLGLTHLTGAMLLAALGASALLRWIRLRFLVRNREGALHMLKTGFVCGLGMLAVAPYYLRVLTGSNPHLAGRQEMSPLFIANDVVGKLFLGDRVWLVVLAWLVLLAGTVSLWIRGRQRAEARTALFVVGVTSVLLAAASWRTQYLSARYFTAAAPLIYVLFAQGLHAAAHAGLRPFGREHYARGLLWIFLLILAGVHACVFLPRAYRLEEKHFDFAGIARWLNENARQGVPYVMESAYELRFVPGYYATPGLAAAAPYVHGAGPDEIRRLRERQRAFLEQFPEAIFVETGHVGLHDMPELGPWTWLYGAYRQNVQLANSDLRALINMGIFPGYFRKDLLPVSFITDIRYNTREDILQIRRAAGLPAVFFFPDWACVPFERHPQGMWANYARYRSDLSGEIEAVSLAPAPVQGRILVHMAIDGDPSERFRVQMAVGNDILAESEAYAGRFFNLETGTLSLPPDGMKLVVRVEQKALTRFRGMLLRDAVFQPWSEK